MTPAALVGLMVVAAATPPPSETVDKLSCVAAHEAAQDFRHRGLPAQAREQLLLCADPRCPGLVAEECQTLLADIDREEPAAGSVASSPVEVATEQPAPGPREQDDVSAVASRPLEQGAAMPPGRALTAPPLRKPRPAGPPASLLPGGLAVVALAGAAFFGWRGLSQAEDLRRTCSPDCDPSQVSPVRRQLLIADLSLLTGVGLGAVTAWMVWSERSREAAGSPVASSTSRGQGPPGMGWSLLPGLGAVRVEYGGRF